MATKKQLIAEIEHLNTLITKSTQVVIRLEETVDKYEMRSLDLHQDNSILNRRLADETAVVRELSNSLADATRDSNAHTSFITAQAQYINYLMNR